VKIAGSHELPHERERAFALLQDPSVLARAIPGCDELTQIGPDEYSMRMKVAVASISGLFAGKVRLADSNPPDSFRLIVEGNGKVGFLKGEGLLTLSPKNGHTEVRYEGDVQVGGMIAAVGQRLLDTTARMIIKRFFEKLAAV
jgi:carbon monoxide dehydrogenase subunit G